MSRSEVGDYGKGWERVKNGGMEWIGLGEKLGGEFTSFWELGAVMAPFKRKKAAGPKTQPL